MEKKSASELGEMQSESLIASESIFWTEGA
jgi:hypothetical protein